MSVAGTAGVLCAAAGVGIALGFPATWLMIRVARRIGYVDHPGAHKSHEQSMPYGGGVAIAAATVIPVGLAMLLSPGLDPVWLEARLGAEAAALCGGLRLRLPEGVTILVGALVMHVMGVVDDVRPLGPYPKLLVTVAVGLLVSVYGGVHVADFAGRPAAIAMTVLWIVVVCNAFNFLDNMDGLSAGVAAVCSVFLVAAGLLAGQVLVPALACLFLGALLGFLHFNFPPARVFMGDAGSLFVGYMMAVLTAMTTYFDSRGGGTPYALAMPLIILAVPLYDFASVVFIRLAEGRNPMRGDQRHFSHRLVERGLSRRNAVLTIYLAAAATGLSATLLPGADLRQSVTLTVIVALVLAIIFILESPLRTRHAR